MLYKVITISSKKLRVRAEPSINSDVVGHLYKYNIYNCEPVSDEWARTTSADTGAIGNVSRECSRPCKPVENDISITFTLTYLFSMIDYIYSLL